MSLWHPDFYIHWCMCTLDFQNNVPEKWIHIKQHCTFNLCFVESVFPLKWRLVLTNRSVYPVRTLKCSLRGTQTACWLSPLRSSSMNSTFQVRSRKYKILTIKYLSYLCLWCKLRCLFCSHDSKEPVHKHRQVSEATWVKEWTTNEELLICCLCTLVLGLISVKRLCFSEKETYLEDSFLIRSASNACTFHGKASKCNHIMSNNGN